MRTAIYGGSFNPPHLGHRSAAMTVMEELMPDRLLILPDNIPPHKQMANGSPSGEKRMELCRAAFAGIPGIEFDDREIRRKGRSYTVDTLAELRRDFPEDEFYLVVGSDMLLTFTQWYRYRDILKDCTLTVLSREGNDLNELEAAAQTLRTDCGANVILLDHKPFVVSSSEVRRRLTEGNAQGLLSPEVLEIIRSEKLYQ